MPLYGPGSRLDWLTNATFTGSPHVSLDGTLMLLPDDLTPNRGWVDISQDGDAELWSCPVPPRRKGFHAYLSGVDGRRGTITKQTLAPKPYDRQSWMANQPVIKGPAPNRSRRGADVSALPAPPAPQVTSVATTKEGLPAGDYMAAYGLADEAGRRTTISGYTAAEASVAAGQGLKLWIPDGIRSLAPYLDWYLTDETGDPSTGRVQRRIRLEHFTGDSYDFSGPYREHSQLAPTTNQTMIGRPRRPVLGEHSAWAYVVRGKGNFAMQAHTYRFFLTLKSPRGMSLASDDTQEITISGANANRAFRFHPPRKRELPEGWGFVPWVQIGGTNYRVYPRRGRDRGTGFVFYPDDPEYDNWREEGIPVYGFLPKNEPRRLRFGLKHRDKPSEDRTGIEPPDATSGPDAPTPYGLSYPSPGKYWGAISDEDETGKESLVSPANRVTITTGNTVRVEPSQRVNKLLNPEGAEREADGGVRDWTRTNANLTSLMKFSDGKAIIDVTSTLAATASNTRPRWESPIFAVTPEMNVTVAGTVQCTRFLSGSSGSAEIQLQELDDTNTQTAITTVASVSAEGASWVGPDGVTFGPGGTAWNANTTKAQFQFRLTGSAVNMRASARDLALFAFAGALRKYDEPAPGQPANPNPPASQAYPEASEARIGPPPSAPGVATSVPTPPVNLSTFESGFTDGANIADGATISSWTYFRTPSTNTTSSVTTTTPVAGQRSWYISDLASGGATGVGKVYRERTFTDSAMGGTSVKSQAVAAVHKVLQMPSYGTYIGSVATSAGTGTGSTLARVRLGPGGELRLYYVSPTGGEDRFATAVNSVKNGSLIDWELIVEGGDSANGKATLLVGLNGEPRRPLATLSGLDYSTRRPRTVRVGITTADDARNTAIFRVDNVVVTATGDVLDRLAPSAPASATGIIAPDRPQKVHPGAWAASTALSLNTRRRPTGGNGNGHEYIVTTAGTTGATEPTWPTDPGATVTSGTVTFTEAGSIWREFDANNAPINQMWLFLEDGIEATDDWGPRTTRNIPVVPGSTYTQAVWGSHTIFTEPENPPRPFYVTLYGDDMPPLDIGSPYPSGATGRVGWTEYVQTITVPTGYYEAEITSRNMRGGVYRWQEHLFALGNLSTVSARDAKRTYGRATSASFRYVIDTRGKQTELTPAIGEWWTDFGVQQGKDDIASPNALQNVAYRTSADGVSWSTSRTNPALVVENKVLEIYGELAGDGIDTPHIHRRGLYLETRTAEAVLLNSKRQHLPGKILLGQIPTASTSPEYTVSTADGVPIASAIPNSVTKLAAFTVVAYTGEAAEWLRELSPNDPVYLEDPFAEGTGMIYRLRFYDVLEVDEAPIGALRIYAGSRRALVTCETPGAFVAEGAPMNARRG